MTRAARRAVSHFWRSQRRNFSSTLRRPSNDSRNPLLAPVVFTGAVCFGSFGLVAIWDYEKDLEVEAESLSTWQRYRPSRWLLPEPRKERSSLERFVRTSLFALREVLPPRAQVWWDDIATDPRCHTVGPIIGLNIALYGLLLLPPLHPIRARYFVHQCGSGRALPLLLSTFAHGGPLHLFFNSYVLWNFGDMGVEIMGNREQFYAAYASAGTLSSLGSIGLDYLLLVVRGFPLTSALGASGALCALLAATGLTHPDLRIGMAGLPDHLNVDAVSALQAMVAFDTIGLMTRWSPLGHAAHLSGAAVGYYAVEMGGLEHIREYQSHVVEFYKTTIRPYIQ